MPLAVRRIDAGESVDFIRNDALAFSDHMDDERAAAWAKGVETERAFAAFDGDLLVASAGSFGFSVSVPGGRTLPCAAVSWVGVRPTHRRRGALRALMETQLDDVVARGEPVAVLTASETPIYRRFGYGLATFAVRAEIDKPHAELARPSGGGGRMRLVTGDEARKVLPEVYERSFRRHPGEVSRNDVWWDLTMSGVHESDGHRWNVVHESDGGEVDGFARYRVQDAEHPPGQLAKRVQVLDLVAVDDAVRLALWEYLTSIDLVGTIELHVAPVEDPLRWALPDPRRLRTTILADWLWLRILDVPAALEARTYEVDGALVLDVTDPFRPATSGRYRVEPGSCTRTDAEPDLALDVAELGSLYLGGVAATTLAAAGRITEVRAGALAVADRFFASHPAPFCGTEF